MYDDIIVAISTYSNGVVGRKYGSTLEAVKDGGYSVWNKAKIKSMFNFGNGTMDDLRRFLKNNYETIIPTPIFLGILETLPNANEHYDFIKDILHL